MWRTIKMRMPSPRMPRPRPVTALAEFAFDPNPGNLRAFALPPRGRGQALVVLLHGCGQTASGYDAGTGWSQLAAEQGFAVLAMEQKAVNNPATCFNWFVPQDVARGEGEVASIAAAIQAMIAAHKLDAARVFITGLSAGGAMTAAMLACYPELFAAGAIIAGLPFGAAANVRDAMEAMRAPPARTARQWGDAVRAASPHKGPWPRVAIWHGDADTTVAIANARAATLQWADLHGLALDQAREVRGPQDTRLSWGDALEVITVPGLGHGVPIDAGDLGAPLPFILETGISSTRQIAAFFGLAEGLAETAQAAPRPARPTPSVLPRIERILRPREAPTGQAGIEKIIRRALKAAGLLKRK